MSDNTHIQWAEATWNPVTGCTKVSPGCAHCYIETTPPFRMAGRRFDGQGRIPLAATRPSGRRTCGCGSSRRCGVPRRIQRQRTKGWRMPEGAVYVGRPTRWANPFRVGHTHPYDANRTVKDSAEAVDLYRQNCDWRTGTYPDAPRVAERLRGKDLACWCPLDEACHADVLLEWANAEGVGAHDRAS